MRNRIQQRVFRSNQRRFLWCWVVGILFLMGQFLFGQTRTFYEHGYKIEYYTEKDGLADPTIGGLEQSKNGYLWITTGENLQRYDGYNFENIELDTSILTFTNQDEFYFLTLDKNDNIWISTAKGVIQYDPINEVFHRYYTGDRVIDYCSNSRIDTLGNLWVGAMNGLNLIDKKGDFVHFGMKSIEDIMQPILDSLRGNAQFWLSNTDIERGQTKLIPFTINEKTNLNVVCNSRIDEAYQLEDYGWIEDEQGNKIWTANLSRSQNTGGWHFSNRTNIEQLTLEAGDYSLIYKKSSKPVLSAYHTYIDPEKINTPKKESSSWYGIQLFEDNQMVQTKLELINRKYTHLVGLPSAYNYTLFQEETNDIWWFSENDFGKLELGKEEIGFTTIWSPFSKKMPRKITAITQKDDTHFWMAGQRKIWGSDYFE